ncbi:protease-4 [Muriicola jejuensis]|uniref:Signal peptide peptidase SppA n=1 Tax=Muriicola jejuensis TaxID=504488 RepID=A0A6P0U8M1_9FLAO|nr:signal peptide peptidase SppA [Muriicola jejuensis]NER09434.1 signal peptide peptidase SppA [Muriicola jejuensis]SMP08692.1 protease-4 [Muriicola jejuensis]
MNFLRNLLAAILGTLIAFGILFFMFLIFISLAGAEEGVVVKRNSVLDLQIKDPINDYTGNNEADPFAGLFEDAVGLDDILHAIAVAKTDDRIKGISVRNQFVMAGWSQVKAIRDALTDFKESGKFVYAYADMYMQKDYFLASVADSVFLNPVGNMDFRGLSAEVLYFKKLQEKTGVKMEVVRHGKYKSAVEPFLQDEMSEENRTQIRELLESIWASILDDVSSDRVLEPADLNAIADSLGGRTPALALRSGLIDGTLYMDQYESRIKTALGISDDEDIDYVELNDYMKEARKKSIYKGSDRIAVIYAQGEIFYGEGGPNFIGQGLINEALIRAREDNKIKAVVLRVNSPGGSALTSDLIWREVELTKKVKPVVVSMGDVAASGGYYIAAAADKILAEPTTITGSIGVFGTIPNISELARDIGINAEQVETNEYSTEYSLFEPMSPEFRNVITESIENTYQTFLQRVASGRNITVERADSLAQGRVWSGTEALELGLVDQLGGLDDAIEVAAELADISSFSIRRYPRYKSNFEMLMEDLSGASERAKEDLLRSEMGEDGYRLYREVRNAVQQKGVQARIPFSITIR